jgi:hypothetical protein
VNSLRGMTSSSAQSRLLRLFPSVLVLELIPGIDSLEQHLIFEACRGWLANLKMTANLTTLGALVSLEGSAIRRKLKPNFVRYNEGLSSHEPRLANGFQVKLGCAAGPQNQEGDHSGQPRWEAREHISDFGPPRVWREFLVTLSPGL